MHSSMCMLDSKFKIYIPRSIVKTEKELNNGYQTKQQT